MLRHTEMVERRQKILRSHFKKQNPSLGNEEANV